MSCNICFLHNHVSCFEDCTLVFELLIFALLFLTFPSFKTLSWVPPKPITVFSLSLFVLLHSSSSFCSKFDAVITFWPRKLYPTSRASKRAFLLQCFWKAIPYIISCICLSYAFTIQPHFSFFQVIQWLPINNYQTCYLIYLFFLEPLPSLFLLLPPAVTCFTFTTLDQAPWPSWQPLNFHRTSTYTYSLPLNTLK